MIVDHFIPDDLSSTTHARRSTIVDYVVPSA